MSFDLSENDPDLSSSPDSLYGKQSQESSTKSALPVGHTKASIGIIQKGKRKRLPVSCQFCRIRKLKCDKQNPCSNCVKKNSCNCVYASLGRKRGGEETAHVNQEVQLAEANSGSKVSSIDFGQRLTVDNFLASKSSSNNKYGYQGRSSKEMKDRLDKMEKVVMQLLMQQQNNNEGEEAQSKTGFENGGDIEEQLDQIGESLGLLKLDKSGKSIYHGDTHWGYLFSEVVEVQQFFQMLRSLYEGNKVLNSDTICQMVEGAADSMSLPFAGTKYKSSSKDLLGTIPSRQICEILIDRYFSVFEPIVHIVHRPSFEQQFELFWQNPNDTDLLWVAELLGILVIGLQSFPLSELPEPLNENTSVLWNEWLDAIEMCGFLGRLTVKPSLLNMRVLILWLLIQSFNHDFIEKGWTSAGLVVRVAQSMGLHRDPKWFTMSPFEAQERRRIWVIVSMIDTHISVGQGLPFGFRSEDVDVELPQNMNDSDMMPDFQYIPKSKDFLSTKTDVSFTVCRNMILQIQRKAFLLCGSLKNSNAEGTVYSEVWEIDSNLRKVYNNDIPKTFRQNVTETSPSEPLDIAIQRFFLEIDFLKTLVVLHRPFSSPMLAAPKFRLSKTAMINSSCTIVERHYWFFASQEATKLKNRFFWIVSALTFSYVIHAAMFIGISLWNNYDGITEPERQKRLRVLDMAIEMMDMVGVTIAYEIRQSILVRMMLSQVKEMGKMTPEQRKAKSIYHQEPEILDSAVGSEADRRGKSLTMELDTSDVDFRLDSLKNLGNDGCCPLAATAATAKKGQDSLSVPLTIDSEDYYLSSANTDSSGHSRSIPDDTPPSANSLPVQLNTSAANIYEAGQNYNANSNESNPANAGGVFQDGFMDNQKMEQIVGSAEWDNFMKGLEQEGFEGLKPLNSYL